MFNLNARDLLAKRTDLIEKVLKLDLETALEKVADYYNDLDNLLSENPAVTIRVEHTVTLKKLIETLQQSNFVCVDIDPTAIKVLLPTVTDAAVASVQAIEQAPIEEVKTEVQTSTPTPVVVKPIEYSHTDLQMGGGNPF